MSKSPSPTSSRNPSSKLGHDPLKGFEKYIEAATSDSPLEDLELPAPAIAEEPQPSSRALDPVERARAMAAKAACPHIGLPDDPEIRYLGPDQDHHCFARRRSRPVTIEYQKQFCLSEDYGKCEIFLTAQEAGKRADGKEGESSLEWLRRVFNPKR